MGYKNNIRKKQQKQRFMILTNFKNARGVSRSMNTNGVVDFLNSSFFKILDWIWLCWHSPPPPWTRLLPPNVLIYTSRISWHFPPKKCGKLFKFPWLELEISPWMGAYERLYNDGQCSSHLVHLRLRDGPDCDLCSKETAEYTL